jgi:hypothetical protein
MTPVRRAIYDANNESFNPYCGAALLSYPDLQDWITEGTNIVTISPKLVSHLGSNTLRVIK